MSHTCIACERTFAIPRVDVAVCPVCRTRNPTRFCGEIRSELEANCSHLAVPSVAAGRAIAYSSAIYRFATHGERMDMGKIESHLASMHGESAAASHSKLALVSGREYEGLVDERACACCSTRCMGIAARLSQYAGARMSRRLYRSVPWIGGLLVLLTVGSAVRRKGLFGGMVDSALDFTPFVGGAKNLVEARRGRDFIPDRRPRRP